MKNKRFWFLLGGIVIFSSAFLLFNFRMAVSNTQAMKSVITTSQDKVLDPIQRPDKISIGLVGEGPLVGALQKALAEKMDKAGMGKIELVQKLEPAYQNPGLVVKVGPGLLWTPFFAMSRFSIHAGYASNGDSAYMEFVEKTHTSIGNSDHSILNMYAEYEVNDLSFGLVSRPGYHQYLANYLAQEIVAALKDTYH